MTAPGTGPYWFVATPRAAGNLLANPSMEYGTAGWAGTGGATLGSSSFAQTSGAWSLRATGLSSGTGATATATLGSGTYYAASAWVRLDAVSGGSVQLHFAGTSTRTPVGSIWQRVSVGTVATSTASRTLAIQGYSATGGTLYADAVVVENGSVPSTYIDGDQPGCQWTGGPHASPSTRTSQTRAGGSISRLADLGMTVDESPGIGAPPLQTISQPYAVIDGSEYQRTRVAARQFSLVSQVIGTSWANLHAKREQIIDALKIDATGEPMPLTLLYAGAGGTAQIGAVWDGGLEFGEVDGMTEPGAVARFMSPDPYWYSQRQEGTTLAPYTVLGSVNYIAYRDPEGRWGTFGAAGTTVNAAVTAINAQRPGSVFVGGNFSAAGGTTTALLAYHAGGAWGTLGGGVAGEPADLLWDAAYGSLYIAGQLTTVGGTTTRGVGWWRGAATFGTLATGGIGGGGSDAYALRWGVDGALIVGGDFLTVNGTASPGVARWSGAWGTFIGGTVGQRIYTLDRFPGGDFAVGGLITEAGGTGISGFAVYQWNNQSWGSYGVDVTSLYAIAISASSEVYGIVGTAYKLKPGGAQQLTGIAPSGADIGRTDAIALANGYVLACPVARVNGWFGSAVGYAVWNGYNWTPSDLLGLTNPNFCYKLDVDALGTIYAGGRFTGVGSAASITTVVNRGGAATYPALRLRNTGSGTARVYQLLNTTNGTTAGIWFDYVMSPGEVAVLNLSPGSRAFTSNSQGNILGNIIGGSNLATWRLNPGTNTVSFLANSASIEASLYWPLRNWSADAEQTS